jgi:hypothetical protein
MTEVSDIATEIRETKMLDKSVLEWMESLGDQADEVIGMMFAAAEVEMTLRLLRFEIDAEQSQCK